LCVVLSIDVIVVIKIGLDSTIGNFIGGSGEVFSTVTPDVIGRAVAGEATTVDGNGVSGRALGGAGSGILVVVVDVGVKTGGACSVYTSSDQTLAVRGSFLKDSVSVGGG